MKTLSASEVQHNFAHLIDMTHDGPVAIESDGRPTVVMISIEDYERSDICDDEYWAARAEEAEKEGYLGVEESEAQLKYWMNAPD